MTQIECCICGSTDQWQNVDHYRLKPANMCICMICGFCTYPETIAKSEDLKEFYRNEYREAPSVQALFTGQRKLHYHNEFLGDLFREWKKKGTEPHVFEIGSAIGMFLKFIRDNFPKAKVQGTELTKTYRRVAEHFHKVTLQEEFDDTQKYDLVATYKVAEHIPNINKDIQRYANALKPDGYLYISVPTWFNQMCNFGLGGFSLDYYYHPNHINVWTRKLFETLLKKCGLEVVKANYVFYDSTYLCKKNDSMKEIAPQYESAVEILDRMDRIKKASMAFDMGKFQDALTIWPNFPEAHINAYETRRQQWHNQGWPTILEKVIHPAKESCPDTFQVCIFACDLAMRYDQWELAIQFAEEALKKKPSDPGALIALSSTFRQLAERSTDPAQKIHYFKEARAVTQFLSQTSFEHAHQAVTWLFADIAKIPMSLEEEYSKAPEVKKAVS